MFQLAIQKTKMKESIIYLQLTSYDFIFNKFYHRNKRSSTFVSVLKVLHYSKDSHYD
jgi:hypothetical protein